MLEKNSFIFFLIFTLQQFPLIRLSIVALLASNRRSLLSHRSEDRLSLPTCGIRNVPTCKGARYQYSSLSHGWWKLNGRTQRPRIPKWLSHSLAEWLQLPIEWLLLLSSVLKSTDSQRWTPSFPGRLDHLPRRWIRPTGRSKPGYIEVPSTLTLASFNWIGKILLGVQVIYRALFCWISPTGRCDPGYQVISANLVFLDLEQLAWACLCLSLTPLHLLEVLMDR